MNITEEMVNVYIKLKAERGWSDDFLIQMLSVCNVPRQVFADYFDQCVERKEMVPLEKMETVGDIRDYVMKSMLVRPEKLRLGKSIAFMSQLKQPALQNG